MELRHLRYFVAVAEAKSFRRAAEQLHIAQPPLSLQIRQLEQEIGARLLERSKRHVALTEAGVAFLVEARQILAHAGKAVDAARRASRGETGQLSIGFLPSADLTNVLPSIYPIFRKRFPDVRINLNSLSGSQQIAALKAAQIDVGFLRQPASEDGIVVKSILREPLVAVMPAHHRLAIRNRVPLTELGHEPFIFFQRQLLPGFYDLIISFCRGAGFSPSVVFEIDHIQTALGFVAMGLGVTLVPASVVCLKREGVVYRPLRPPVPHVELAVAYRQGEKSSPLRNFLEVVDEVSRHQFDWKAPAVRRSRAALESRRGRRPALTTMPLQPVESPNAGRRHARHSWSRRRRVTV